MKDVSEEGPGFERAGMPRDLLHVTGLILGSPSFAPAAGMVATTLTVCLVFQALAPRGWLVQTALGALAAIPAWLVAVGLASVASVQFGRAPKPPAIEPGRYWLARIAFPAAGAMAVARHGERPESAPVYDAVDIERTEDAIALRLVSDAGLTRADSYPLLLPRDPELLVGLARTLASIGQSEAAAADGASPDGKGGAARPDAG